MDITTIHTPGIISQSVAYDPTNNAFVFGGNKLYTQGAAYPTILTTPTTQPCTSPPSNLRFVYNEKNYSKLSISLNGLGVMSKISSKTNEEILVRTNYGFSSGVHKWEIICPISCACLKFGICQADNDKEEMVSFRTTTSRVVTVILDLKSLVLKFLLNGKDFDSRNKTITSGTWYPAIKIWGLNNYAILNPYTPTPLDYGTPASLVPFYLISALPLTKAPNTKAFLCSALNIKEEDIEECFINKNEQELCQGNALIQMKYGKNPPLSANGIDVKLADSVPNLMSSEIMKEYIKNGNSALSEKLKGFAIYSNDASFVEMNSNVKYLPYTDKMLVVSENKIQLCYRDSISNIFDFKNLNFDPIPTSIDSTTILVMTQQEASTIIKEIDWTQAALTYPCQVKSILSTIDSISSASQNEGIIYVRGRYQDLYNFINVATKLAQEIFPSATSNLAESRVLVSILSNLDEQLYLKSPLTQKYPVTSRPHTAYSRLNSMIAWPLKNSIELADLGFYCCGQNGLELRNYQFPNITIPSIINLNSQKNLIQTLQKIMPYNPILKGQPTNNVPLSVSLKFKPARMHKGLNEKDKITHVCGGDQSQFLLTGSDDGTYIIWASGLGLVKICEGCMKQSNVNPEEKGKAKEASCLLQSGEDWCFRIFDDTAAVSSPTEIKEVKDEVKKEEAKKETVEPKQELLEQLLQMGFKLSLSRQALIETNNTDADAAIEKYYELEKNKKDTRDEEEINVILSWECMSCTYINHEGKKACDMCGNPAPVSAFITKKALEEKHKKAQEEKDIKEKVKKEEENAQLAIKKKEEEAKKINAREAWLQVSNIIDYMLIQHSENQTMPFTVGCFLTNGAQSLLKLRRFQINKQYAESYYLTENGSQLCKINGLTDTNAPVDCRFQIESLIPEYMDSLNFNSMYYKLTQEYEIRLDIQNISSHVVIKRKDEYYAYISCNDQNGPCIVIVSITLSTSDRLSAKVYASKPLAENSKIFSNGDVLIVASKSKVTVYSFDLELLSEKSIDFIDYRNLVFIKSKKHSYQLAETLLNKTIIYTPEGSIEEKVSKPLEISNNQLSLLGQNIDEKAICLEDVIGISKLTNCSLTPFKCDISDKNALHYCIGTSTPQSFYLHNYENISTNGLTMEIELGEYTPIDHIALNISLLPVSKAKKEVVSVEGHAEAKNAQVLGLLSIQSIESEKESANLHLPLRIFSFEGSQFSSVHNPANILILNTESIFSSNYPNTQYVFSHYHNKKMIIDKISVRSLAAPISGGIPLGCGLIFVSDNPTNFSFISKFKGITSEKYQSWKADRIKNKSPIKDFEPVGYFDMGDEIEYSCEMDIKKPGKYICLYPTNTKKSLRNSYPFKDLPIEFQYFGVTGTVLDENDVTVEELNSASILSNCSVAIDIDGTNELTISEIPLTELDAGVAPINPEINSAEDIEQKLLESGITPVVSKLNLYGLKDVQKHITIKINGLSEKNFKLSSASIQIYKPSDLDVEMKLFKSFSATSIRTCLSDTKYYGTLVEKIALIINNPATKKDLKLEAVNLLSLVIKRNQKFATLVFKTLDLENYISNIILSSDSQKNVGEYFQLLQLLQSENNFSQSILTIVKKAIVEATCHPHTVPGFEALIGMINWVAPIDKSGIFHILLKTLQNNICEAYSQKLTDKNSLICRQRIGVHAFPFEPCIYMSLGEKKCPQYYKTPLYMKALVTCTPFDQQMLIDLKDRCVINELHLMFGKIEGRECRLLVTIYQYSNNNKEIAYQTLYPESYWAQCCELSYKVENKDELERITIPKLNIISRYIGVSIQMQKAYKDFSIETELNTNISIIPEIYGKVLGPYEDVPSIIEKISQLGDGEKKLISIGHSVPVEILTVKNQHLIYYQGSSAIKQEESDAKKENLCSISGEITKLQTILSTSIEEYLLKESDTTDMKRTINNIVEMQKLVPLGTYVPTDYLLLLASEYCKIMKNLFNLDINLKKEVSQLKDLPQIAQSIFKNLIICQNHSEYVTLLKDVIIESMTDEDWANLIISSVDHYLSTPICYLSQQKIIETLDILSIPEGKLLSYFLQKFSIPMTKGNTVTKQITSDAFTLSGAVLILLQSTIGRINPPVGDIIHKGIICNYCSEKKYISGIRYKCGHCSNINICQQCMKKHTTEYPDHVLIQIAAPLPYAPSKKDVMNLHYKPLLPPLQFKTTEEHDIDCDNCHDKKIVGTLYLCANCDEYALCSKCFAKNIAHNKTHVFLILEHPIVKPEIEGTPKPYLRLLDPLLYPLYLAEEELTLPTLGRSMSETRVSSRLEIHSMDYDECLWAVFCVSKWICNNGNLDDKSKLILLKPTLEIIKCLFRLCGIEAIRRISEDIEGLELLISTVFYLNDHSLLGMLTSIIDFMKDPSIILTNDKKLSKVEANANSVAAHEVIENLGICLQNRIMNLISLAYEPTKKPLDAIYADRHIWSEHIAEILQMFISTHEKLLAQKPAEIEDLTAISLTRSVSTPIRKEDIKSKQRPEVTTQYIVKNLCALLNPTSTKFTQYPLLWSLVFKSLELLEIQKIMELHIFDQLIKYFLESSGDIQQLMSSHILKITQSITVHATDLCTFLFNIIWATIDASITTKQEKASYSIIMGWLDIVQAKQTPKPDNFVDSVALSVSENNLQLMITKCSEYLYKYLNCGSKDGCSGCNLKTVMRLEIIYEILKIIFYSKASNGLSSLSMFYKSTNASVVDGIFGKLICWMLLNEKTKGSGSVASELMKKISDLVKDIITLSSENELLLPVALKHLLSQIKTIDRVLPKITETQKANIEFSVQLCNRANKILLEIIESWIVNDKLAHQFVFDLKGFEFIMERIELKLSTITESKTKVNDTKLHSDIENALSKFKEKVSSQVSEEAVVNKSKKYDMVSSCPIELGKLLVLTSTSAGDAVTNFGSLDWSINKKGVRQKCYSKNLTGDNKNEFVMNFKLKSPVEINDIQIGVINFWTGSNELYNEPLSVLVEGGMSADQLHTSIQLSSLHDKGLENNGVSVYGKNLITLSENYHDDPNTTIREKLTSHYQFRAKYLKITFKRGVNACVENSPMVPMLNKQRFFGLNFISVLGCDLSNTGDYHQFIMDQMKETASKILSIMCSGDFKTTLQFISNDEKMIAQLKGTFEDMLKMISDKPALIEPTITSLAIYNPTVGNWILLELLKAGRSKAAISMIEEIVLNYPPMIIERQITIHNFIFTEISRAFALPKAERMNMLKWLTQFIRIYIRIIHLSSKMIKDPTPLEFTEESMNQCVYMINDAPKSIQQKLCSLAMLYFFPPAPFINKSVAPFDFCKKHLDTSIIVALLASTDEECAKYILNEKYNMASICKGLPKGEGQINIIKFWIIAFASDIIRKYFAENEIGFIMYESIKCKESSAQTILVSMTEEVLQLVVEFIRLCTCGYPNLEKKMAIKLIEDLNELTSKRDMQFVTKVVVPLLSMETTMPVCIHPFDSSLKKYVAVKHKHQFSKFTKDKDIDIKSKIISKDQINALNKFMRSKLPNTFYKKLCSSAMISLPVPDKFIQSTFSQLWEIMQSQSTFFLIVRATLGDHDIIFGGFCNSTFPKKESPMEADTNHSIPFSEENFLFYYDKSGNSHFVFSPGEQFGSIDVDSMGSGGFFSLGNSVFSVSYSDDNTAYINEYSDASLKCVESPTTKFTNSTITVKQMEVFAYRFSKSVETKSNPMLLKMSPVQHPWYNSEMAYNYFRANPVYNVPILVKSETLTMSLFEEKKSLSSSRGIIKGCLDEEYKTCKNVNSILDLYLDLQEAADLTSAPAKKDDEESIEGYVPKMGAFDQFEELGGVKELIRVTVKALNLWKNVDLAKKWQQWMMELEKFITIPMFFKLFIKNKKCKTLLFKVLSGLPEEETNVTDKKKKEDAEKKWEQEKQSGIKFSYQKVAEVFKLSDSKEIRDKALENGFIDSIIERLALITGEKGRKWIENPEELAKKEEEKEVKKAEDPKKKKEEKKKKQGVGYSQNVGEVWKVDQYFESEKQKNEQIQILVDILNYFCNPKVWTAPKEFCDKLGLSGLMLLLEHAFLSGSLLDMNKIAYLYHSYFDLVTTFSESNNLIQLLLPLDPHIHPKQSDSVTNLLKKLYELSSIFLNCYKEANDNTGADIFAKHIISTYETLTDRIERFRSSTGPLVVYKDILSLPLNEKYLILLKDLRFDYMDMYDDGNLVHHYASYASTNKNPPPTKQLRLAQELADLSNSLPCEHTNAIFFRVDKSRMDFAKAIVMGANDTPYAHGAFEYDIFFDDKYPNEPPKMNLTTTGSGAVRFNPNLYNCGKVCLSLLGTWRGQANENWDPKYSTIMQVLVSTQAIIMSELVYFNEPGFEGEMGTVEGDKKNEAYCNIVRYCNIKFAMLEQIRHPSKGFEVVILRHFYLKKDEILKEVKSWVDLADKNEAQYVGLVNDHNVNWAKTFKEKKTKYKEMLIDIIKELEEELNKIKPPSEEDLIKFTTKAKAKKKNVEIISTGQSFEEVNVADDTDMKTKSMNINDESVKDRWSRYIGAMGIEAVAKQANSNVFLSGLNALGVEIAKNIILAGCKSLTLHDNKSAAFSDLSGQFFLTAEDVGKNRAECCWKKIQQLNYYVKVEKSTATSIDPESLKGITVLILTESSLQEQCKLNEYCRKNNILFISAECHGLTGRVFNDFGNEFTILDKDGEEPVDIMLESISTENEGVVKVLKGTRHNLEDNDIIVIKEVVGMNKGKDSINGTLHKVKVVNPETFKIGNTTEYTKYERNGTIRVVKQKVIQKHLPLKDALDKEVYDKSLIDMDSEKSSAWPIMHSTLKAIDKFMIINKRAPKPWGIEDAEQILKLANEMMKIDEKFNNLIKLMVFTYNGTLNPLCTFIGGIVTQEAVKGMTQKYSPINQFLYYHLAELAPAIPESKEKLVEMITNEKLNSTDDRYCGIRMCIGSTQLNKLHESKVFVVGMGAIGCELLKNYAMCGIGVGKKGQIITTDPDVIETSNLNRQFLFREKHLRKPKSITAAAVVCTMNPELKGHLIARLDKVHDDTLHIYNDKFYSELSSVTNALDNVEARRFIDSRCVSNRIPLVESGTLGPKGHVQVVVPMKTESYRTGNDPQETNEIPHCTLKMFPEETLHCVEWARDKFGRLFTQNPQSLNIALNKMKAVTSQEIRSVKDAIRMLKKRPTSFTDCIAWARNKFQKYFVNDIRQLMCVYPIDAKTKEGRLFWTLPKRPPKELVFDPKNPVHCAFISAASCLRASLFGIPIPEKPRAEDFKVAIGEKASLIKVQDFIPNETKAQSISKQTEKPVEDSKEPEEQLDGEALLAELKQLTAKLTGYKAGTEISKPEQFEKDNDANFHIDFIYAMTNCRASNYKLEEMSWINVKLKAGRIVAALATTTAVVAGLQTVEYIKLLLSAKVESHRNSFVNLALPFCQMSEPGIAPTTTLKPGLKVNLWDRWEISATTLGELLKKLESSYALKPKDVMVGSAPIFLSAIMDRPEKKSEREQLMSKKIADLVDTQEKYVDMSITFTNPPEEKILQGVPPVRVFFT